jgi:hypothetical protein
MLLGGGPPHARPDGRTTAARVLEMTAARAEQEAGRMRELQETRQWRAQAAARAFRQERQVASGAAYSASKDAERALAHVGRVNIGL